MFAQSESDQQRTSTEWPTSVDATALSLGSMTMGGRDRFAHIGTLGVADTSHLLDLCLEAGVNLIDTADVYSFGAAEEILGEALVGRRHQFVISTKVFMRMGKGVHDTGLSRQHIIAACEDIRAGRLRKHFILDMIQGGAGTSRT